MRVGSFTVFSHKGSANPDRCVVCGVSTWLQLLIVEALQLSMYTAF